MSRAGWRVAGATLLALLGVGRLAGRTPVVDPYSLSMAQAACGDERGSPPPSMFSGHVENAALRPGVARVYVITETRGIFGSRGEPVRLGMDGKWFGANQSYVYGYSYVDVSPGVHHLCVASTIKGVLPHTSAAMLLTRVDAVAGQSYFFYNVCIRLARIFTLRPIGADEAAMYIAALPSTKAPRLSQTAAAQAACGADPDRMPAGAVPTPALPGPPATGQALVYFFSGVPQFGHYGLFDILIGSPQSGYAGPIHVGLDGRWIGKTQVKSYLAVTMAPGVHRLCSATRLIPGTTPVVHLSQLGVVAGKTYFVDTGTLRPVEHSVATMWLRRIAAMPKSDVPDLNALKLWNRTDFPASERELRDCGIPIADSGEAAPAPPPTMAGKPPAAQVFFVLTSNQKLNPHDAINVGLDGRWVASLRRTSWASVPLSVGQHEVCIHTEPRTDRGVLALDPASSLDLFSVNEADGMNIYFQSWYVTEDYGSTVGSGRLDPDEGALLVAYYPNTNTLQH